MRELFIPQPLKVTLRNVPSPPSPQEDEVIVQVAYGGICGSDISVFKGLLKHASYPLRPGHELVGTIAAAGPQSPYPTGTRVVVLPNTFCGQCDLCRAGRTNLCRNKKSLGVNMDGGFADEFVIRSSFVLPIPDDLPDEKAALVEPFAVVVHAFKKVSITKGSRVAIFGSGNEGMLAAALAVFLGADVTAVDINPNKLRLVKEIGVGRAVYPDELITEEFDVVIDTSGVPSAVEQGIQLVKPGGAMILIGLTPAANFPVIQMVRNEWTLYGSIIYNFPADYLTAIDYLTDQRLHVEPIISKILPVEAYQEAYESAMSGDFGKILIKFSSHN